MSVFDAPVNEVKKALGDKICKALLSNGYKTASFAATAKEAADMAIAMIPDNASVGIPGTVTARELGLPDMLAGKNCTVFHHWDPALKPEQKNSRLTDENNADWFITSSNAITFDGKMINIDGTGNRVACMAWGIGKILYIVSLNKAEKDVESAIARARNAATPPNALRVGSKPPCTQIGHCVGCNAPDRTCRVLTIMERVPFGREAHVILVGEDLGY